jgi:hypothetical protein
MTTSKILRDLLCSSLYSNMDSQGWFPISFSRIPIFHLSLNRRTTTGLPDPAIQLKKNALQDSLRSESIAKMTGVLEKAKYPRILAFMHYMIDYTS